MSHPSGPHGIQRRDFIRWGSFSGAALMLGITADDRIISATHSVAVPFTPNQWITIDETGMVTIVASRSEMGQGTRTSEPMIVAEELGADWSRVRVRHARPGAQFSDMRTSGSGSVVRTWRNLRPVAAAAREMLIAAAARAWNVAATECTAERHAVVHGATGRRLDFARLVDAASRLPVPTAPTLKPRQAFSLLGTRVARVDGPQIVRGTAMYGLDVRVPGMRFAAVKRCPKAGGVVRRFDDTRSRAIPGYVRSVQISHGVAAIADRTWSAFRARDALAVEWDMTRASAGSSRDYVAALDAALGSGRSARRSGDVAAALATAARRVQATYICPFQAHAAMEPLSCVADVRDDRCEVWAGTQAPNEAQAAIATLLGIPTDRVTVNVCLLGGGFGRRLAEDYIIEAVEVARAIRAPVQVVWSREDDIQHDMFQPAQVNRLTAALDASGKPVAWRHEVADYHLTMFGDFSPSPNPGASGDPWGAFDTPYEFAAIDVTLASLRSPVRTGAWRAVTYPAAVFARESFVDEVAQATGRDPLDLRLSLIPSPGQFRRGTLDIPNGDRLRNVLRLAADRAGWAAPFPRERDGRRWGRGIACNSYHDQTMVAQVAEVSVGAAGDVRVHRVVCAVDCGQVINRSGLEAQFEGGVVWALSAALKGSITFEDGTPTQSNFHDFPVLRMNEAPVVEVHIVPSELRPFGAGEQPVPAVWPAIANAIFMATGRRSRTLPITSQ